MRANIDFAKRTGFNEIYVWGVEWWYWMKTVHHDARYWNYAQDAVYTPRSLLETL